MNTYIRWKVELFLHEQVQDQVHDQVQVQVFQDKVVWLIWGKGSVAVIYFTYRTSIPTVR